MSVIHNYMDIIITNNNNNAINSINTYIYLHICLSFVSCDTPPFKSPFAQHIGDTAWVQRHKAAFPGAF